MAKIITAKKKSTKSSKPDAASILKAFSYRVEISNLASFFKRSKMDAVCFHLTEAYKEIDRIWEEGDFSSDSFKPVAAKGNQRS